MQATTATATTENRIPVLFSPAVDFLAFGGSALLALAMLPIGAALGVLHADSPRWMWVTAILLIDVAHVYATGFRVYFDTDELRQRPWLYALTPLLAFLVGASIYSESVTVFWSVLAYLAVFHFIRQQYGWVALYRSREGDHERLGWWIDAIAIYMATVYPLIYWHTHLPRQFTWFTEGDFLSLPTWIGVVAEPLYWASLAAYFGRSIYRGMRQGAWNPGKDLVVVTTAICWYVGIISLNSDYAFTVTNVIIHGVPYMVLIYWYRWHRSSASRDSALGAAEVHAVSRWKTAAGRLSLFLGAIWVLAYAEELLWDRGVWNEQDWLFGWATFGAGESNPTIGSRSSGFGFWLAPLLAVPQITHYVLDGFIWRRSARRD
ncbi:hypothetical protein [Rhodopirellula sallentina]|uniref:Putative membrane protein n=1 Tax=Rhodopirellula sallentina SM41 TaxID=1263870 RepID=M5UL66_9BACT|nr:hypothetical protein [Rhodopirellula sallentina]EMI56743.1 putative membrane protein [Rhodopirellula sallentina SM41]